MSSTPHFSGSAQLRQDLDGPLDCELRGVASDNPQMPLLLRFALRQPARLPSTLQDAQLRAAAGGSNGGDCELRAANLPQPLALRAAVLHRDAEALAERVIAPRAVRWRTRMFWRVVFLLMRTSYGRALLLRRYQK